MCEQKRGVNTLISMDNNTIYSRFHEWVMRQPDAIAITSATGDVTYAALDCRVNTLAHRLGDRQGKFTGVVMPHSADMIATILAILKSGSAYIPAEPSLPTERIRYMMEQAQAGLVITEEFCQGSYDACPFTADLSTPDSIAYVLYTSGTSGRPKGVMVANHSVVNYAKAFATEFHTSPGDVMLQYSVCSFDTAKESDRWRHQSPDGFRHSKQGDGDKRLSLSSGRDEQA